MFDQGLDQRELRRRRFTERCLTAPAARGLSPDRAAREIYQQIAEQRAGEGLLPIQERIFGPPDVRGEVLTARREVLHDRGLEDQTPCTYMSRKSEEADEPIWVQLWGVIPREGEDLEVKTVSLPCGRRGRLLVSPELRLVWLSGIAGTQEGRLARGISEQAERMFHNAEAGLASHGFEYTDVIRTWISSRRILDWYGELNRIRTAFHHRQGITGGPTGRAFPASTGIQGRSGDEECLMDLLAVRLADGEGAVTPLLWSGRQSQPFNYGSGFSRGMALTLDGAQTVFVSGTASIGPEGRTLHLDDVEAQALETLLSVAALLETRGGSLGDICSGVLFYKEEAGYQAYEEVTRLLGLPDLPLVPVMADVCRPELLIEIEATAFVPGPSPSQVGQMPRTQISQPG